MSKRIDVLSKDNQEAIPLADGIEMIDTGNNPLEIPKITEKIKEEMLASFQGKLQEYFDDEIFGTLIDLV